MIYPELVPKKICKTDIHVKIYDEGSSEDGAPIVLLEKDLKCNWQSKAKRVLTNEKVVIVITGTAYFNGDIATEISEISGGEIIIFGEKRRIFRGTKARNPDGSVNYTMLEIV